MNNRFSAISSGETNIDPAISKCDTELGKSVRFNWKASHFLYKAGILVRFEDIGIVNVNYSVR